MEILKISNKEFKTLEPYKPDSEIWHTESKIYYDPHNHKRILKVYNADYNKKWMKAKLKAIKNLIRFTNEHNVPELLKPDGIALVNGHFKASILPIIPGKNASYYLNAKYTPIEVKLEILKQIGEIIKKINEADPNAALSDVHADNFLVDGIFDYDTKDTSRIKTRAVDTDSMKIYDSKGTINFYLYGNTNLYELEKYEVKKNQIIPNAETDIFCFIMIIMHLISNNDHIYMINIDSYLRYIEYLDKMGFDSNLLTSLASIYNPKINNISPLPYLDSLTNISEKSNWSSFLRS